MFCTGSPSATVLYASVSYVDGDGTERYGYAPVPVDAPGVVLHDDWDALGMRASGQPVRLVRGRRAAGRGRARRLPGGRRAGLHRAQPARGAVPCVGLARHRRVGERHRERRRSRGAASPTPARATLVAENAIDLAAARASLSRAAERIDESAVGEGDILALFAEAQAAKIFVNDAASRVVDRTLILSGGSGYLNGSPLARAYRDVKAGAFMHPLGANRAYEFLADISLGRDPAVH